MYTSKQILSHIKESTEAANLTASTQAIKKLEEKTEEMFEEMRTSVELYLNGAEMAAVSRGDLSSWLQENGFELNLKSCLNTGKYLYEFKIS